MLLRFNFLETNTFKYNFFFLFKEVMQFPQRQLEIVIQCFEEVEKKPVGFFYAPVAQLDRATAF